MTIQEKIKECLQTTSEHQTTLDLEEDFYMDTLNGVGFKTMEDAYMAGVLNERYGFYLSDGLWVYPNGQFIQD
jgi:hypothetical protein